MSNAFNINYRVVDDLKGVINDEFLQPLTDKQKARMQMIHGSNPQPMDFLRTLEPFEKCARCLKSVSLSKI
jgi:hypothetical protein